MKDSNGILGINRVFPQPAQHADERRLIRKNSFPLSSRLVAAKRAGMGVQDYEVQPHVVEKFMETTVSLNNRADDGRTARHHESQSHRFMDPNHLKWEARAKIALRRST